MTARVTTVPVRLPVSLKEAIERLTAAEGISVNQFLVSAASEKLGAMQTAETFFAERRGKGNKDAAVRILTRSGGDAPRPGDEQA